MTVLKEQIAKLAAEELEELLSIVGDLGNVGYKICLCKLKGFSYQQCANKFGIQRANAQKIWVKCRKKGYDEALKRIFYLQ